MPGDRNNHRVREPEGNGIARAAIHPNAKGKPAVGENIRHHRRAGESRAHRVRPALNETWLVARHGYRTPAQVRADQRRLDQDAVDDLQLAACRSAQPHVLKDCGRVPAC